jgi:hypothetical protein
MSERKNPLGILIFIGFIILVDVIFFIYRGNSLLFSYNEYATFFSFSLDSVVMWLDMVLTLLSFLIIPYGFLRRKNSARIFAFVFLTYSLIRILLYIVMTGEKTIGLLFFSFFVIAMMYLLMSSVTLYFGKEPVPVTPTEMIKEYTYGLYTLYTELVHLRNGKKQVIYFFSKHSPKSGTPTTLPRGYHVEVSDRSGLPYLKKNEGAYVTPS